MATRTLQKLTAIAVQRKQKSGCYSDGGGLYLQVGNVGNKSWIFRFMRQGRPREMGLGPLHTVSLGEAREKALKCRKLLLDGLDPIEARNSDRRLAMVEQSKSIPFKQCAETYISTHESTWKNAKHAAQWTSTMEAYVYPVIGALPVSEVDTGHILSILEKDNFWLTKTETASRVRGRVENILDWATVREFRAGPNPARWRGHLDKTLPPRSKVQVVKHHVALPYVELPPFFSELKKEEGAAARALEVIILTATRTIETIGTKLPEIDEAKCLWTIPASRMKAKREHKVPLSDLAATLIKTQMKLVEGEYLFPGMQLKKHLSNMACLALLERMGKKGLTVHGFRSSFRDWASEQTNFSNEVVEMSLAHAIEDKVEAAYRRGDLLEKRRKLMGQWADYCSGKFSAKVQPISTSKRAKAA